MSPAIFAVPSGVLAAPMAFGFFFARFRFAICAFFVHLGFPIGCLRCRGRFGFSGSSILVFAACHSA